MNYIGSKVVDYGTFSGDVETCTYSYYEKNGEYWCKEDWHDCFVKPSWHKVANVPDNLS